MNGWPLSVSLWQLISRWDQSALLSINRGLANPFFDGLMPYLRDSVVWAPLYLFLFAFMLTNFGSRGAWWCLCFIATVGLADLTGTYVFKEAVQRLRPCNNPWFSGQVRLVLHSCPGGYSFLSNHAANHFAMAAFISTTLLPVLGRRIRFIYVWAAAICFAQLYVGVHYPTDVVAGTLLGLTCGVILAIVYQHNFGRLDSFT